MTAVPGEPFDGKVTVGVMYIMKLHHLGRRQDPCAVHRTLFAGHAATLGWKGPIWRSAAR